MSDINLSNLQVPPAITMPMHVAESNPHPQYVRLNDLSSAVKGVISVSDLKDVDVGENQANNTLLIFNAGTYRPITVTELGTQITVPYATDTSAGIIRIAQTIWETDNCATTPRQVVEYVTSNSYTLPEAQEYTLGGVTLYQIRSIALSVAREGNNNFVLEYATTTDMGGVVLATDQEVLAGTNASKVITPATLAVALNNVGEYALPMATSNIRGGVKTIETNNPEGKAHVINLINDNWSRVHTNDTTYPTIAEFVPQIEYNQYVNVRVANDLNAPYGTELYYKTYEIISSETNAETAAAVNNYPVIYTVYSNGVLSGRDAAGDNDYKAVRVDVKAQGAIYDINTNGLIMVSQEGIAKRLTIGPSCYAEVHGEAHNVSVSTAVSGLLLTNTIGGGVGGDLAIMNHGHVTYCTVTQAGNIQVADGVIENVIVSDTSKNNGIPIGGLVIGTQGKGYNITLTGSDAAVYVSGYAKDVVVHKGCCVWAAAETTRIDNLILYTGAEVKLVAGATITGCVVHPGAIVSLPEEGSATVLYNTCREPDHTVKVLQTRIEKYDHYDEVIENGEVVVSDHTERGTEYMFAGETTRTGLPYKVAYYEPRYGVLSNVFYENGEYTNTYLGATVSSRIDVWSIDMPRGLVRVDKTAVDKITSLVVSDADTMNSLVRLQKSAYQYYNAEIESCLKDDKNGIYNHYTLVPPEGLQDDLVTITSTTYIDVPQSGGTYENVEVVVEFSPKNDVEWKVVF